LFGFGIRWAILSGAAAGQALAAEDPDRYERFWKKRLRACHQTAATNRWFYERLVMPVCCDIIQRGATCVSG